VGANSPNPRSRGVEDKSSPPGWVRQFALAMDLPFVLVGGFLIGVGAGYFLDRRLHSSPWFTVFLGLGGFAGGMLEVVRRLTRKRNGDG